MDAVWSVVPPSEGAEQLWTLKRCRASCLSVNSVVDGEKSADLLDIVFSTVRSPPLGQRRFGESGAYDR